MTINLGNESKKFWEVLYSTSEKKVFKFSPDLYITMTITYKSEEAVTIPGSKSSKSNLYSLYQIMKSIEGPWDGDIGLALYYKNKRAGAVLKKSYGSLLIIPSNKAKRVTRYPGLKK